MIKETIVPGRNIFKKNNGIKILTLFGAALISVNAFAEAVPNTQQTIIGERVASNSVPGSDQIYQCDFCDDQLDIRFRQMMEKTSYKGEWYAVDVPSGDVNHYSVARENGKLNIQQEVVDDGTKDYVKAAQKLFNENGQSYLIKMKSEVFLKSVK